jgi:hypothetical protein
MKAEAREGTFQALLNAWIESPAFQHYLMHKDGAMFPLFTALIELFYLVLLLYAQLWRLSIRIGNILLKTPFKTNRKNSPIV